jgi:peptide/nickel transport system permease protein
MRAYIVRRLLIAAVMVWAASVLGFFVMKLAPGSYLDRLRADPRVNQQTVEDYARRFGLNRPPLEQYVRWLRAFASLDLGYSFGHQQPVSKVIRSRLANTLLMNLLAILVTWIIALPLGIYAAVHQYSRLDKLLSGLSFVGMSLPGFFLALLMLWVFAGELNWLPAGGLRSVGFEEMPFLSRLGDLALHLVIPTTVLAFGGLASLQRITRGNMLEVLRQQYITTARAKGLPENRVIYRHALRNAINPLITIFGYECSGLFSGAALLEIIISYPGMGQMMYEALLTKDEPLVMAVFMLGAMMLLLGNLLADILLSVADPRIVYK